MGKNIYFTKQGLEELKEAIEKTKDLIAETGRQAFEARVGREQSAISEAVLAEFATNYELQRLENLLENAALIEPHGNKNLVDFGDRVNLKLNGEGNSVVLTGNYLRKGDEITINSPLGNAIFGKGVGDPFSFNIDSRKLNGTITEIIKQEKINETEKSL
jgi:transcription elongation GreA/GreB family factor